MYARYWRLRRHRLTRSRIRQTLMWHLDRWVTWEVLAEVVWGGQADGGPLLAHNIVAINIYKLRKEGYRIENKWGHGWRLRRGPEVMDERGRPLDPRAAAWFRAHPEPAPAPLNNRCPIRGKWLPNGPRT